MRTRGSLLIVMLGHSAMNAWSNFMDPSAAGEMRPFTLMVVLMWVVALALVAFYGPARLSRQSAPETPNPTENSPAQRIE